MTEVANPLAELESGVVTNDTMDRDVAEALGDVAIGDQVGVTGTIGNSPAGAADVDWYQFDVLEPVVVSINTANQQAGSEQIPVLGLYQEVDAFADPTSPGGFRLLEQDQALPGGEAQLERVLAPGTYFVAVSGAGNRYFHPYLANSGNKGSEGDYGLVVSATDAGIDPTAGPVLLSVDVGSERPLDRSPLVIRANFSTQVDPNSLFDFFTFSPAYSLNYSATGEPGTFFTPVPLPPSFLFTPVDELQLVPDAPLTPGFYQVSFSPSVTDLLGNPLVDSTDYPAAFTFEVQGVHGDTSANPDPNDSIANPIPLDNVMDGLVQVSGAIGDDPAYPVFTPGPPFFLLPGSDVDLYRFTFPEGSDTGNSALIAEVYAGRIGSALTPGLSLFREDESGELILMASNAGTGNNTTATNGQVPLFGDAALFADLSPGVYYLAVSSSDNVPSLFADNTGIFDPTVSHSGAGSSTGNYVLNVLIQSDDVSPSVVQTSVQSEQVVDTPLTTLTIEFDEPVNLPQLVDQGIAQGLNGPPAVFIRDEFGVDHVPRLVAYDLTINQATFLFLEAVPNGEVSLHVSSELGLTDLAGNPLDAEDPSGDYLVSFTLDVPPRGSPDDVRLWVSSQPEDSLDNPQDIGPLFAQELADPGVSIVRDETTNVSAIPNDFADFYRFELTQERGYFFQITSADLPPGATFQLELFDENGPLPPAALLPLPGGLFLTDLADGVYTARVWAQGSDPVDLSTLTYELNLELSDSAGDPTPLTNGAAPIFRIRLGTVAPPPETPTPPPDNRPPVGPEAPQQDGPPVGPKPPQQGGTPVGVANPPQVVIPTNSPGTPTTPTLSLPTVITNGTPGNPTLAGSPQTDGGDSGSTTNTGTTGQARVTFVPSPVGTEGSGATDNTPTTNPSQTSFVAFSNPGLDLGGVLPAIGNVPQGSSVASLALPTGVLTALGANPLGGVRATNSSTEGTTILRLNLDNTTLPQGEGRSPISSGPASDSVGGADGSPKSSEQENANTDGENNYKENNQEGGEDSTAPKPADGKAPSTATQPKASARKTGQAQPELLFSPSLLQQAAAFLNGWFPTSGLFPLGMGIWFPGILPQEKILWDGVDAQAEDQPIHPDHSNQTLSEENEQSGLDGALAMLACVALQERSTRQGENRKPQGSPGTDPELTTSYAWSERPTPSGR